MRRRVLVFDLDGTLVDTAPDLHDTLNIVLARHGRPPVEFAAVRMMVGDGARRLVERGLAATGVPLPEPAFEAAMADFLAHYEARLSLHSRPFPDCLPVLQRLREAGCRLAVCTNKPHRFSVRLLADLGMLELFDAVVGGDSLPTRKPDPGHLLGTLAALAANRDEAVMIGDSLNDVAVARGVGVPVVAVSFGYTAITPDQLGADVLIDHFNELEAALDRLEDVEPLAPTLSPQTGR